MTIAELKIFKESFKPFTIITVDGKSTYVHHQDFLHTLPNNRIIVINQEQTSFKFIDIDQITSIEQ